MSKKTPKPTASKVDVAALLAQIEAQKEEIEAQKSRADTLAAQVTASKADDWRALPVVDDATVGITFPGAPQTLLQALRRSHRPARQALVEDRQTDDNAFGGLILSVLRDAFITASEKAGVASEKIARAAGTSKEKSAKSFDVARSKAIGLIAKHEWQLPRVTIGGNVVMGTTTHDYRDAQRAMRNNIALKVAVTEVASREA